MSKHIADSECNLACVANGTQICGGALKVSVYEVKPEAENVKGAAPHVMERSLMGVLGLALVGGLMMC